MKFGKKFQEEQRQLPQDKREQRIFTRRVNTVLAVLALTGAGLYAGMKSGSESIPKGTPEVSVTVAPNQGADNIIAETEPSALANPDERQALENDIIGQGTAANHQLEAGQTVHVPIIDPNHK